VKVRIAVGDNGRLVGVVVGRDSGTRAGRASSPAHHRVRKDDRKGAADHEWAECNMPLTIPMPRRNQADPVGASQDEPWQSTVEQGRTT
jgi:hypothetical protein